MSEIMFKQMREVARLRDEEDLEWEAIGNQFGFSERTARRRYEASKTIGASIEEVIEETVLQDFPKVDELNITVDSDFVPEDKVALTRFEPLVCVGDAMLTADLHIPLHDPVFINTMINCAKINNIKKLIIGGDFFHMDQFSSYLPYQPEAALEVERHDGNVVMKTLCRWFDEIYFIWGNHDFRLTKKLGFKKSFEECMLWMLNGLTEEELTKVKISDLDYMMYYPAEGERPIRICHPREFSRIPLTVARNLAQKYSTGVATAHSHHCAIGVAPNGTDLLIDLGGFFDKKRTEYIQKTNASHEWVQGFHFFKDKVPTIVSPVLGTDAAYRKEVSS